MSAAELSGVLSLGSNLGDREATLRAAVADIAAIEGVTLVAASSIVETPALKPQGVDVSAPAYLNAAVAIRTTLGPEELLAALAGIERDHGRVREERWGDRTLDVDIVTLGGLVLFSEALTLPHPRASQRAFVLVPWLELDANAMLPGHGPVSELLVALHDEVRRYPAEALA